VTAKHTASALFGLLARASERGYIGEPVSQLEHALQCARLAQDEGADDLMVAAALLHDVGHLAGAEGYEPMDGLGVHEHERVGGAYLRSLGMHEAVCDLVTGHVDAKRYLVRRDPSYAARLSPASICTLKLQGGPMSEEEAVAFERSWKHERLLQLQRWDDEAKVMGKEVPGLPHYAPLLTALLSVTDRPERPASSRISPV
jgi:phosphonate degradation associated HDIG domain protein